MEVPIAGMDCADCTRHVQEAVSALPGVTAVQVLLSSEKAIIQIDPRQVDLPAIRRAVEQAGYQVPATETPAPGPDTGRPFARQILGLLGVVFGVIFGVVVGGEWLGGFAWLTTWVPWPVGWLVVGVAGYPIFRNVVRATLRRQVISHTLMSVGVVAALAVGQWPTALVVVFFMRVGDYNEKMTTERARRAVKDLAALAPQTARVERAGTEVLVAVADVQVGEVVVVRPGDQIPVDGEVLTGQATINQAAITGEPMPVEVGPGAQVFAATLAQGGSLRVQATRVGRETTFGRVIALVEEAEAHRADVQRLADRVSAWYLPVVAGIAALTFLLRQDPLATAAVLVVACSCSFALATPIAMLASIGAAARRGLLIKGSKYLETLARADVLLVDKTGTLTLGRPQITDVIACAGARAEEVLALAGAAERYSEHPLAEAVRQAVAARQIPLGTPVGFTALPGAGVRAEINGHQITVGNRRLLPADADTSPVSALEAEGKALLFVVRDGQLLGILAAADTLRPDVAAALAQVRALGIGHIELLTGDHEQAASALTGQLGIAYRANLLPEDKIAAVRAYQAQGRVVVMIGDGVNDAPALAQADVGVAMGVAGTAIAIEAGHVVLLRDDWTLVPDLLRIAQRTMRVVKGNLGFTVAYNVIGLSLAALGWLPPVIAAAAQSLPDVGILANSARLLRQK
jgi:Cd2+/Zn2+-exporting ATPase/Cu+-exporting ATPase